MDGPYSIEQAHIVFGGHFRTCPLGLVEKPGSTALCMIHHFLKDDQFGQSTNSWVNSDDFPTRWFMVSQMADFVSCLFMSIFIATLSIPFNHVLTFTCHVSFYIHFILFLLFHHMPLRLQVYSLHVSLLA